MLAIGNYDPEQLKMLCAVLEDHCAKHGIERSSREHEEASTLILSLYENGARSADDLRAVLELTNSAVDSTWLGEYSLGSWNTATDRSSGRYASK